MLATTEVNSHCEVLGGPEKGKSSPTTTMNWTHAEQQVYLPTLGHPALPCLSQIFSTGPSPTCHRQVCPPWWDTAQACILPQSPPPHTTGPTSASLCSADVSKSTAVRALTQTWHQRLPHLVAYTPFPVIILPPPMQVLTQATS